MLWRPRSVPRVLACRRGICIGLVCDVRWEWRRRSRMGRRAGSSLGLERGGFAVRARLTGADTMARLAEAYRSGGWPATADGDALTAPFSAPSAGLPPWHLYRLSLRRAAGVASGEPRLTTVVRSPGGGPGADRRQDRTATLVGIRYEGHGPGEALLVASRTSEPAAALHRRLELVLLRAIKQNWSAARGQLLLRHGTRSRVVEVVTVVGVLSNSGRCRDNLRECWAPAVVSGGEAARVPSRASASGRCPGRRGG